jgi:hypothetical protein
MGPICETASCGLLVSDRRTGRAGRISWLWGRRFFYLFRDLLFSLFWGVWLSAEKKGEA